MSPNDPEIDANILRAPVPGCPFDDLSVPKLAECPLLQASLVACDDAVAVFDRELRIVSASDSFSTLFGVSAEKLLGYRYRELPKESLAYQGLIPSLVDLNVERRPRHDVIIGERHFEVSWTPISATDGLARIYVQSAVDVTKRVQETVAATQVRSAMMQAPEGIIICNPDGSILQVNPAWVLMHGYPAEKIIPGLKIGMFHSKEQLEQELSPMFDEMRRQGTSKREVGHQRADGSTFTAWMTCTEIRDDQGLLVGFGATAHDLTETKGLQRQLIIAQKYETIGTLAAGLAHDLNNILSPILMSATLLQNPHGQSVADLAEIIESSAKRGAELVASMLSIARKSKPTAGKSNINLSTIVDEVVTLARQSIRSSIEVRSKVDTAANLVYAEGSQIHQVLMNLVTNAKQAMDTKETGLMVIDLKSLTLKAKEVDHLPEGSYLRISVTDSGCGILESDMGRIFDPYFTTKPFGEGTGLGLAICNSIIRDHGGCIVVLSKVDIGTTFSIYLPSQSSVQSIDDAHIARPALPRGTERILIVDDERMLGELASSMLEMYGYKPKVFSNSEKALAYFSAHPSEFDALLTDQTMPRLTGLMLAEQVRELRPNLPIILCTGYCEQIIGKDPGSLGITAVLDKPYTIDQLLITMRHGIDKM